MKIFRNALDWSRILIVIVLLCLISGSVKLLFDIKYQSVVAAKREVLIGMANDLDVQLTGRLTALQLLAGDLEIRNYDSREATEEMRRAANTLGFFNMVLADANGKIQRKAFPDRSLGIIMDLASFNKAMSGKIVVSDRITRGTIDDSFVSLRVPIYTMSEETGVLAAGLRINEIGGILNMNIAPVKDSVFIVDKSLHFIYHPWLHDIFPEHLDYSTYKTNLFAKDSGEVFGISVHDGKEKLYLYESLDNADWRVVMAIPVNVLYMTVFKEMLPELIVIVLLVVVLALSYRSLNQHRRLRAEQEQMRIARLTGISQLAAGIAHEIRNPLTAIKGFIQLMQSKKDADFSKYYDVIFTEIERIEKLADEFRLLAKPPQSMVLIPTDLVDIIRDVLLLMENQAVEKSIHVAFRAIHHPGEPVTCQLSFEDGCVPRGLYLVPGDESRLKQVFINLLRNSIEATASNGHIQIMLSKNNKEMTVAIKDNGRGMSPEALSNIGTPFYTTKESGTGLGLSICYSIVEQHGGRIEVVSHPGQGSTFSVVLPVLEKQNAGMEK